MRPAGSSAALIVAAGLAAAASAQKTMQTEGEVFVEALEACASMFSERHPAASPPSFPPSSSPFIDNGYGKERAAAYGFKPLRVEDLMKSGWAVEWTGQVRARLELAKQGDWGRATITPSDLDCGFGMFAVRDGVLDADRLLGTMTSWVAKTYPGASMVGEAETLDERFNGPRRGKPSSLRRTEWKSPDGMRVSMSITRPDAERGALIVSARMNYLPGRLLPAPPQSPPI